MSTTDPTGSDAVPPGPVAGLASMDVQTTQQVVREMTMLTSALFSLLQPHRAPAPETATPEPFVASTPVPAAPVVAIEAPVPPRPAATAPVTSIPVPSIPVPSLPVPDLPFPETEPESGSADKEGKPARDNRQSMALMNEIAFLDE